MAERVLHSKRTITPGGVIDSFVIVRDGKIIDVSRTMPSGMEDKLVDLGEKILMPGVVDPHVHINEPGRTEWEGFVTATKAAISGGVTSLVDMPLNSIPATTNVDAFKLKLSAAESKLSANVGFWGGVVPGNTSDLLPLAAAGVLGYKAFLVHSGVDEFQNVSESDLETAMPVIADTGLPLLVHCELETEAVAVKMNSRSFLNYMRSRPPSWELDAIEMMIRLCRKFRCRVHIVHLAAAGALPMIERAKDEGLPLTAETAQHYLFFDADKIEDGATVYKTAPPIREKENQQALWRGLEKGIIDFVATDHSPAPPEMKNPESGEFMSAWGGISSIQFALPALWTAARKMGIDICWIADWLCRKPADFAGLNKGVIEKGRDADLVCWDPEASFTVTSEMIHHKHKQTPYAGASLYGEIDSTWIGGDMVYSRGKFLNLNKGKIILNGR